jgi:two-component system nitrogen regulation response regulator GlnG
MAKHPMRITGMAERHAENQQGRNTDDLSDLDENRGLAAAVKRHLQVYFSAHDDGMPSEGLYDRILCEVEKPLIELSLAATRGNQVRAARLLGVNRNTLRKKIQRLKIPVKRAKK